MKRLEKWIDQMRVPGGLRAAMIFLATASLVFFFGPVAGNAQRSNADAGERAGQFTVAGEVLKPGPQPIKAGGTMTLKEAISRAGGLGEWADIRRTKITRRDKDGLFETTIVHLKSIKDSDDLIIRDGDYVFVPKIVMGRGF